MTIKYLDGRAFEAVLLSRTETMIRLALEGADDVTELRNVNGTWVSEDREPVLIEFAWQRNARKPTIAEAECCCSRELASRLIRLLSTHSQKDEAALSASSPSTSAGYQ
jgi:hypothetical protein